MAMLTSAFGKTRDVGICLIVALLALVLQEADSSAAGHHGTTRDEIAAALALHGTVDVSAMFTHDAGTIAASADQFAATLPPSVLILARYGTVPAMAMRLTTPNDLEALTNHPRLTSLVLPPAAGTFSQLVMQEDVAPTNGRSSTIARVYGAPQFQRSGYNGEGRVIAILDSGIDGTHPDLATTISFERCSVAFSNATCPNGSDFQTGPGASADDVGHGTRISGIVASGGTQSPLGIAPEAQLEVYKVGGAAGLDFYDVLDALDFIASNRPTVDVVNLSVASDTVFDGPCPRSLWPEFHDIVVELRSLGVAVVSPSGNQAQLGMSAFPACLDPVISVAATTVGTALVPATNTDQSTDVTAPGFRLDTTDLGGAATSVTGSSFATPIVAACIGLMLQEGVASVDAIEARLESSQLQSRRGTLTIPWASCAPLCAGRVVTHNLDFAQAPTINSDVILGTLDDDIINGLAGDDAICSFDGNDVVEGGPGDDTIHAGRGDDQIFAGPGNDIANGQRGDDTIYGGSGEDRLYGSWGHDLMYGDAGNDIVHGKAGRDEIYGGDGDDNIHAGQGADEVYGGLGADLINLGAGRDLALGGGGDDKIAGQGGHDTFYGLEGNDRIWGQNGSDFIHGGRGDDFLNGGAGHDECVGDQGADEARRCEQLGDTP